MIDNIIAVFHVVGIETLRSCQVIAYHVGNLCVLSFTTVSVPVLMITLMLSPWSWCAACCRKMMHLVMSLYSLPDLITDLMQRYRQIHACLLLGIDTTF